MNERIDLTKILKDCPEGTKFYTTVWGEVSFRKLSGGKIYAISIDTCSGNALLTKEGCYVNREDAECILFPSKEQRDWSKFTAPWYKKKKFDHKTLKPFDKVLARFHDQGVWYCELFAFMEDGSKYIRCCGAFYEHCIPYNDETKHLIGTTDEAPEYYRYWED